MRQGKYVVMDGKFVHESDLSKVRILAYVKASVVAAVVAAAFYLAYCIL